MAKGFFNASDIDNDQEIEIVDSFINQVKHDYICKARNDTKNDIERITSNKTTTLLSGLGILSGVIVLLIVRDFTNAYLTIFAFLSVMGNVLTFLQLTRSESYVESIKEVHKNVHNFNNQLQKEKEMEDRINEKKGTS